MVKKTANNSSHGSPGSQHPYVPIRYPLLYPPPCNLIGRLRISLEAAMLSQIISSNIKVIHVHHIKLGKQRKSQRK